MKSYTLPKNFLSLSLIALLASMAAAPSAHATESLTLDQALQKALSQSPDLQAAQAETKAKRLQTRLGLSPFLPEISLEAGQATEESDVFSESGSFAYGKATWNLFNGGRDFASRNQLQFELETSEKSLNLKKTEVERVVTKRFADLLFIDQVMQLQIDELSRNRDLLQIAKRKAAGGLTSNADLLEFEFRESAIRSEQSLLRHERSVASRALTTELGLDPVDQIQVSGTLDRNLGTQIQGMDAEVFISDSAVIESKFAMERAEIEKSASYSVWLPRLDFEGQYGDLQFADPSVPGNPAWRMELRLTMPLFSGMETVTSRSLASEHYRAAEHRFRKASLEAQNQLRDRKEKLTVLDDLLSQQKENIARAEKFYRASVDEYRRGIRNSADVTGATERYFEAKRRELELIHDFVVTRLGLIKETTFELP